MLYRPNFCCHCGEKIARPQWTPLTSRRFCDFCSIEQKQHDLLPRAAAVLILLVGVAGMTAYFRSSAEPKRTDASTTVTPDAKRILQPAVTALPSNTNQANSIPRSNSNGPVMPAVPAKTGQRTSEGRSSTDSVYYCGAMTKKGIACTRRVKTPGRCWQHIGQASIDSMQQ